MADGTNTGLANTAHAAGSSVRVVQMWSTLRTHYMGLAARRRNILLASLLGLVAVAAALTWYAGRTDWRVLFSGLEGRDVQQVSQELGAAGIPFQTTADGAGVEVPAELVDKARMEVAAKGMPGSGRLGFELFDKPNWVGSEFDERVNYQRALEGELEHTIGSLESVRSARVHLVLPQESLFAAEEKQAKASVVLKLRRSMGQDEADSVRNLVASSVQNLSPAQVTLVDADGRANLQSKGRGAHEHDVEQAMEARLIAMLEPLAGTGNVRATVNVSYDEGTEERTDEVYDPTQTATLSVQKSQQLATGGMTHAQGVPGTASNSPAAAADGAVAGGATAAGTAVTGTPPLLKKSTDLPVYPQSTAPGGSRTDESGTYAVTRHVSHTEEGPGRVRRVTAAVVVNDRLTTAGTGKAEHAVWTPRSMDEMHRLEQLAQAAVGFDEKRGDQVVMENVGFTSNAPEVAGGAVSKALEQAKAMLGTQPGLIKTVVVGLLGTLIVLFVLRPVAGQVVSVMREPAALGPGARSMRVAEEEVELNEGVTVTQLEGGDRPEGLGAGAPDEPASLPPRRHPHMKMNSAVYDQVARHIKREPQQSTRLLEAWIGADGEAE
jgi:flagellar M-ring protein FliF